MKRAFTAAGIALVLFWSSGCAMQALGGAKLANIPISGEKAIYLQLDNDIDFVSQTFIEALTVNGFRTNSSSDEPAQSLEQRQGEATRVYKSVSTSNIRYALIVIYAGASTPTVWGYNLITQLKWRARLVDRQEGKTLGTYSYDYSPWAQMTAPKYEDVIAATIDKLVVPAFSIGSETPTNSPLR